MIQQKNKENEIKSINFFVSKKVSAGKFKTIVR